MKTITIIFKNNAGSFISKMGDANAVCYYLHDDYVHFTNLRNRFGKENIRSLGSLFDKTYNEIKESLLVLLAELNKKYDSLEWWGGQIASRNNSSTPLILNISYLFCVKKIVSESDRDIVFIVDSNALSFCIADLAKELGCQVIVQKEGIARLRKKAMLSFFNGAYIVYYFWQAFRNRRVAAKLTKPFKNKKTFAQKRIVIRSWVTKGTLNPSGELIDRNFGILPDWLRSRNYEVLTLPMFFNIGKPFHVLYSNINNNGQLIIPDHYLKWLDYIKVLIDAYKLRRKSIRNVKIEETDVSSLFNEIMRERRIDDYSLFLNLCYPFLKRLKENGIEIDCFLYAFESNSPEKQFIIGCREYFPVSEIVGFQHTAFFPNLLTYHLGPGEEKYHPLPDRIVCSGSVYIKLLKEAGLPHEILFAGPNLRFGSVYIKKTAASGNSSMKKILLLPLTFSYDLAYELFIKVRDALLDTENYKLCIRSHPLLSKEALIKFLRNNGINSVEFADEGTMQDWLKRSYAVISTGGSITILESIVMGVPVIRVIPDNYFFYDPFGTSDYPLKPVNTAVEIEQQLHQIDELMKDNDIFQQIAEQTLSEYFTKPNEENMRVFL